MEFITQREASFILPETDNEHKQLTKLHDDLRKELCREFGGYTATPAIGGWNDDTGETHNEYGYRYTCAMPDTAANFDLFFMIAEKYAMKANQIALYCVHFDGEVEIKDVLQPANDTGNVVYLNTALKH